MTWSFCCSPLWAGPWRQSWWKRRPAREADWRGTPRGSASRGKRACSYRPPGRNGRVNQRTHTARCHLQNVVSAFPCTRWTSRSCNRRAVLCPNSRAVRRSRSKWWGSGPSSPPCRSSRVAGGSAQCRASHCQTLSRPSDRSSAPETLRLTVRVCHKRELLEKNAPVYSSWLPSIAGSLLHRFRKVEFSFFASRLKTMEAMPLTHCVL